MKDISAKARIFYIFIAFLGFFAFQANIDTAKAEQKFENASLQELVNKVDENSGKVVLISFFASWCPPCVEEVPILKKLNKKFLKGKDFKLVSVSLDDNETALKNFISKHNINYPVYLSGQDVIDYFGIKTIPTLVIADRNGQFVDIITGLVSSEEIESTMRKYL